MTVVVTRNVPDRFRGFLASAMLEWAGLLPADGGLLMTWRDPAAPGGQAILTIGWPKAEHVEIDGLWLVRHSGEGRGVR
jgi:CRISPR-associated protein Cas2